MNGTDDIHFFFCLHGLIGLSGWWPVFGAGFAGGGFDPIEAAPDQHLGQCFQERPQPMIPVLTLVQTRNELVEVLPRVLEADFVRTFLPHRPLPALSAGCCWRPANTSRTPFAASGETCSATAPFPGASSGSAGSAPPASGNGTTLPANGSKTLRPEAGW